LGITATGKLSCRFKAKPPPSSTLTMAPTQPWTQNPKKDAVKKFEEFHFCSTYQI